MDRYNHRLQGLLGEENVWQQYTAPPPIPTVDSLADPFAAMSVQGKQTTSNPPHTSSSAKPGRPSANKPAAPAKKVTFKATGLKKGDKSNPNDTTFCPWKLVKSYPHIYIGKGNKTRAAKFFSADALHKNQPWDLYYIYVPHSMKDPTSLILVPTYQFENHLEHINAQLNTNLCIPEGRNAAKFTVSFGLGDSPVPRFLGRSSTAASLDALKKSVPAFNPADNINGLPPQIQEDFMSLLARIQASTKKDLKKKKEKNRLTRYQDHIQWGRSIKRVQRYMGLREKATPAAIVYSVSDTTLENETPATQVPGSEVHVGEPEGSVVFASIDIEAYEFNQNLITEVGMAIFDTLDIRGKQPGPIGDEWFNHIQGHHIRIKENSWANNSVHVKGCADKFDFGQTAFISKADVSRVILSIIERSAIVNFDKTRPVILVFHDKLSDLSYLEKLYIKAGDINGLLEVVDTRDIYQHRAKAMNPTKLATVLTDLGIQYRHLHNAGNDAVYTMQALIALAVQQRRVSRNRAASTNKPAPLNPEEDEGWNTGGENSDGGNAGELPKPIPKGPVMSWDSSPEGSPTKKTAKAPVVQEPLKERHRNCVMDADTSDEGEGEAW